MHTICNIDKFNRFFHSFFMQEGIFRFSFLKEWGKIDILQESEAVFMNHPFAYVSPEAVGIPSDSITKMLARLRARGAEVHSFMLLRHGKLCAQGWYRPYAPEIPHIQFSFSKSFTSTAIGFAEQEGLLRLDEKLVDIFPDCIPENPSENLKKCDISHLLMMGCGHETEIDLFRESDSWITDFLHHPFVHTPGTHFMYNTAGTNMLCAILQRKTGQNLTAFLEPRLFAPLGIAGAKCFTLANGIEAGGFGYKLKTEDMARFTEFVRCKGSWQGKQLLRADWFARATAKQISNAGGDLPDWSAGYGYQFWQCAPAGVFRGDGAFGQYGIVMQAQEAVLVITSCQMAMQPVIQVIWDTLLPAFQEDPLPENPEALARLRHLQESLALTEMLGEAAPEMEASLNGKRYLPKTALPAFTTLIGGAGRLVMDTGSLSALSFTFHSAAGAALHVTESGRSYAIPLGMNGRFVTTEIAGEPFAANARWRSPDKLEAEIRNLLACTGTRFIFHFTAQGMTLTADSTLPVSGGLADEALPEMDFHRLEDTE